MARAIDELRTFTREHPELLEVVPARMMIGRALASEGRLPDAVAEFEAILAMVPSYTDAHGGLAAWLDPSTAQRLLARPALTLLLIKEL